ncbi:hypothetical protein G6F65_015924 [Rhizopus arrhizus]|nr:hypothetical protein G6F65_015924 [Rhizopus arrhizus]
MGPSRVSYAATLFIRGMGRLTSGRPPVGDPAMAHDPSWYADPLPQALVLTAIVIGFATTALFLVVLLASRGLTGTDHVDGRERGDALAGRYQPLYAGGDLGGRHLGPAGRGDCAPGRGRRRRARRLARWRRRLPGGRLARAVRHRAGGGSPGRRHADADRRAGPGHADLCAGPLGPRRRAFPFAIPVPADGLERRLPDGRPLQPVRFLRSAAGGILWPAAARLGRCAGQRGAAIHRREPGGFVPAADQHRADLWRDRHAEHGGPGPARRQPDGRRTHAVRSRGRHPGGGLPGEGGRLAAELLAGEGLRLGRCADRGHVLDHDQGRHLRAVAHRVAAAAVGRACGVQPGLDVRGGPGHAAVRRAGPAGDPAAGEDSGLLRHRVGRHAVDGAGHARRHPDRPRAVLPDQLGADHGRVLHAGRTDRAYAQLRRQRAGGDVGRLRPGRPCVGEPF